MVSARMHVIQFVRWRQGSPIRNRLRERFGSDQLAALDQSQKLLDGEFAHDGCDSLPRVIPEHSPELSGPKESKAGAAVGPGGVQYWQSPPVAPQFKKPEMAPAKPVVELYTRNGCHLCDEAAATLARYGLRYQAVDIDANAELRTRYNECVPVVVIDGKERFRGRIDELLLRRLLVQHGTP
jgi:glutaredoxin